MAQLQQVRVGQQLQSLLLISVVGQVAEEEGEFPLDVEKGLKCKQIDQLCHQAVVGYYYLCRGLLGGEVGKHPDCVSPHFSTGAAQTGHQDVQEGALNEGNCKFLTHSDDVANDAEGILANCLLI